MGKIPTTNNNIFYRRCVTAYFSNSINTHFLTAVISKGLTPTRTNFRRPLASTKLHLVPRVYCVDAVEMTTASKCTVSHNCKLPPPVSAIEVGGCSCVQPQRHFWLDNTRRDSHRIQSICTWHDKPKTTGIHFVTRRCVQMRLTVL